jgi:arylsulfatase A-like enzyme
MALLGTAGCSRLAKLPEDYLPKGGSKMNVILVIIDSLRKDHVGAYGNPWIKTPNLDALAKESLRFTRAYPESIPSIPARRAIHTGLRSFPFRGWHKWSEDDVGLRGWQPIPRNQTTLAEILEDEGYNNLFVTDTLHQFRPFYDMHRGFGVFHFIRGQERDFYRPRTQASSKKIDGVLIGGPSADHAKDIMLQYLANTMGRGEREEDWFAPQVFMKAMDFLEAANEDQPFFLTVDNYDPHEPWDPPGKYVSLYDEGYTGPEPMTSSSGPSDWLTDRQLKRMHARYSAEVTMMDTWLGYFLDKMDELKLFENTLLLVLSDHGHAFGEHGFAGKVPAAMYPELTDITFFIRHPGGKGAGQTSDYYASTHDVAPTVLGAVGIEPPSPMEGQALTVLLGGGEPEPREHFTIGYHDHVWARDESYAMFARSDGSEAKLFNLRDDPGMNKDIAGSNQDVVRRMYQGYVLKDAGGPLP